MKEYNIPVLPDIYQNIRTNKEKHRIKYVINSHVKYADETLPMILSHARREFSQDELIIVLGGAEEDMVVEGEFTFAYTTKNLYDFHAFYFIINHPEYFEGFDYVFYLHDTCVPLPFFKELSYNFVSGVDTYRVWDKSNSNLGLYKIDYLKSRSDFILNTLGSIKNQKAGVGKEDSLVKPGYSYNKWSSLNEIGMGDKLIQVGGDPVGYKDVYGTGNKRRTMLYKNLNLVKFKSNSNRGGYGGTK